MNAIAMLAQTPRRRGSMEAKRASIHQMQPPQAKSPPRDDRDQSMGNSVVVVIRTISEDVQQVGASTYTCREAAKLTSCSEADIAGPTRSCWGSQRLKRIHGDDHTYKMARHFNYRELAEGPLAKKLPRSETQQVRCVAAHPPTSALRRCAATPVLPNDVFLSSYRANVVRTPLLE